MAYETTQVTVEKSQGEIRKLLHKHGASQFRFSEGTDDELRWWAGVEFIHHDHLVRIAAPLKDLEGRASRELDAKVRRARTKTREDFLAEHYEQEAKRIWRVIYWSLKARMEAVDEGLETFEQAFLAHMVDPGTGKTIWDVIRPHVESGRMHVGAGGLPELGAGR